jgi:hypothetical protein
LSRVVDETIEKRRTTREAGESIDTSVENVEEAVKPAFRGIDVNRSEGSGTLSIKIYELRLDDISFSTNVEVNKKVVSIAPSVANVEEVVYGYPRWRYEYTGDITIGEAVDAVLEIESGLLGASYRDLTPMRRDQLFRWSKQLLFASVEKPVAKVAAFENKLGGVDIAAKVYSQTQAGEYSVYISAAKGKIAYGCSCPIGSDGFMCKHVLAVITAMTPKILSTLAGKPEAEESIRKRAQEVFNRVSTRNGGPQAVSYYLGKLVRIKVEKTHVLNPGKVVERLLSGDPSAFEEQVYEKTRPAVGEIKGTSEEIVWSDLADVLRWKVKNTIEDLSKRFGYQGTGDWSYLLGYALATSGSYSSPPVTIHGVGDPGTYKTTGARLLARYVRIPVLRASLRGDPTEIYSFICDSISRNLGVQDVRGRAGGLIRSLSIHGAGVEIEIDLSIAAALARESGGGLESVKALARDLSSRGRVQVYDAPAQLSILDTSTIVALDSVRYRYEVNRATGLMISRSILDAYIVLVDEGSRAGKAVEHLLTITSSPGTSTPFEAPRIFVVTDNVSPYEAAMQTEDLAAFHDRSVKAIARAVRSELLSEKQMQAPPAAVFTSAELDYLARFIASIPVPQGIMHIAKAISLGVEHRFAPRGEYIEVLPRGARGDVELSITSGKVQYYGGGRFLHHALMLSRFNAFLRRASSVSIEDLSSILEILLLSHGRAQSFSELKTGVLADASTIGRYLLRADGYVSRAALLVASAAYGSPDPEKIFPSTIEEAAKDPFMAATLFASIEAAISSYRVDPRKLPRGAKLSAASLALARGDMELLKMLRSEVEKLERESG